MLGPQSFAQQLPGSAARDEQRQLGMLVEQRTPEELRPGGINWRGFILRPVIEQALAYTDNVLAVDNDETGDLISITSPQLLVNKKYGLNHFDFFAGATYRAHFNEKDEDTLSYNINTSGFIAANGSLRFPYFLGTRQGFISRTSSGETKLTEEPVQTRAHKASLGAEYKFNRLSLGILGGYRKNELENAVNKFTGDLIILKDQDFSEEQYQLYANYELGGDNVKPDHILFTTLTYQNQDFEDEPNENGDITSDIRNSKETSILAGIKTNYKGLIVGEVALGYFFRDFENNDDIERFDFLVDLAFNVAPKLTLFASGGREIQQDNTFASGVLTTYAEAGFNYELLHNFYLGSDFRYTIEEYGGNEEADIYETALHLRYLHSRYLESALRLENNIRETDRPDEDYNQNILIYRLIGKL